VGIRSTGKRDVAGTSVIKALRGKPRMDSTVADARRGDVIDT